MTENFLANAIETGNNSNVHKPRIQCPKPATKEALREIRERTPILTAIFMNSGLFLEIALISGLCLPSGYCTPARCLGTPGLRGHPVSVHVPHSPHPPIAMLPAVMVVGG